MINRAAYRLVAPPPLRGLCLQKQPGGIGRLNLHYCIVPPLVLLPSQDANTPIMAALGHESIPIQLSRPLAELNLLALGVSGRRGRIVAE